MKNTQSQGLPYPEVEDYAFASLQLQVLAEAVDAKLVAGHTRYDAILDVPTMVGSLSADQNTSIFNKTIILFDTVEYDSVGGGALGPVFSLVDWPRGLYQAGIYVNSVAGTPTVNTLRRVYLELLDFRGPGAADGYNEVWTTETYESNTGGEYETLHATFELHSPERANLRPYFNHGNTGSTVDVKAGSYWWVSYIGELGS